jgi:glycerol uptake facilitator-like aquaporin
MKEKSVSLPQRLVAESLGTAFLLAAVVGSGIMAQRLAGGNGALALLCNTLPTGAILTVLILTFGPLSGAHFNPAVSIAFALRREISWPDTIAYVIVQIIGGIIGVLFAHAMFELPVWQISATVRTGPGQARRIRRHIRAAPRDLRLSRAESRCSPLRGRPLHHLRILVHGVYVLRESCRDNRPLAL